MTSYYLSRSIKVAYSRWLVNYINMKLSLHNYFLMSLETAKNIMQGMFLFPFPDPDWSSWYLWSLYEKLMTIMNVIGNAGYWIQGLLEQGKTNNIVQTNLSGSAKRRLYFKLMLHETIGTNDF